MRLESNKNIDKTAQLPEGIEFRSEIIWGKIQDQREPKKRAGFWWYTAACAVVILCISYFSPDESTTSSNELLTQINQTQNVFMPLLEKPKKEEEKPKKKFYQSARSDQKYVVKKEEKIDSVEVSKAIQGLVAKTVLGEINLAPHSRLESKEELSLAARRLKKTLENLNKDQVASQTLVVEKFNILNEIIKSNTQASTKGGSGTSLSKILKNKNEKN
jgi:hypothetical protein